MSEKTFMSYFLNYFLRGAAITTVLWLSTILIYWWISFSFPWGLVDVGNPEWRGGIAGVLVAVTLCSLLGAYVNNSDDDNKRKWENYTAEQKQQWLLMHESYTNSHRQTARKKKPLDTVDVVLGVATGAVIGEVINDLLDGD